MFTEKPRLPIRDILLHGFLPSPLKKLFYRIKGYRIGRGVSIGFGSVVLAEDVEIGDGVRLGFLSVIRGKTVRIGPHVQIGAASILDTPHLEIGEGSKINEQVFVGGLQFPDSRLVVGRNCQIMQMTFINPARSIVIGDDTGIGGYCLIFGHTSWLSKFEGYPVEFQPIEIGKSVSVAWRVFVTAGARIGDGAVIGANSLVNQKIPPRCLAAGSPARVVAKAPYFPRVVGEAEKESFLKDIVAEMLAFFEGNGMRCQADGQTYAISEPRGRWFRPRPRSWKLFVASGPVTIEAESHLPPGLDVYLSLRRIPEPVRQGLAGRDILWVDIESKERLDIPNELGEEVLQFLRRYGVRFFRAKACRDRGRAAYQASHAGRTSNDESHRTTANLPEPATSGSAPDSLQTK